jgi:protein arginine N-methyltransferase 1
LHLDEHFGYITDAVRLDAYRRAVAAVVGPGLTVVDLGCGSGVLGLLCLRAGAERLFAIDSTSMIEAAKIVHGEAGFADRVTLLRGMSTMVDLPEMADVVICDQVGYFGFDAGIVEYLEDARKRFVKPGGRVVPQSLKLELAGVESARCYENVGRWRAESLAPEFRALGRFAENTKYPVTLERDEVMGGPAALGEIDLRQDTAEFLSWRVEIACERDGWLHGLAGWFRCELAGGVWMTNSPLAEERIQRPQAFLPLADAVRVAAGERVRCTIMARPKEDFLAWVVETGGKRQSHSTWNSLLLGEKDLRAGNRNAVARLSGEGRAKLAILGYCDGVRTAAEIEETVWREHPELLPSRRALSDLVARVLSRDAELS